MSPACRMSRRVPFRFPFLLALAGAGMAMAQAGDGVLLTAPPPKPIRIPAEFEPMQAVVIVYHMESPTFCSGVTEDAKLIVLWQSEPVRDGMQRDFRAWGVNLDRCEFHRVSGTPTPRDKVPWFMFVDHNEPAFVYNQDYAELPYRLPPYGLEQGYPVYRSGLGVEGGDFMTDGQGTAVSLDGVSIYHAEMGDALAERVRDFWGIHTYHFIPNQRWGLDNYLHVDCLAKCLSPDTVMVVRVPPGDIRREQSELAAAYFSRQVSCYGTPYKVVRIDVLDREPYINSLICNGKVYVPKLDVPADANAVASYAAAMPGYEVISVGHAGVWFPFFALHCDTMGIPDEQMLYIEHTPVLDRPSAADGLPIGAKIVAHSRTAFVEGTPVVLWRTLADANEPRPAPETAAPWNAVAMIRHPESGDHQYLAYIPTQPVGTVVQYYLRARDASGRDETHPYIGAPQAHVFTVTRLGANISAVSAQRGGAAEIYINAGAENAGRSYHLAYALDADSQGAVSPGATLPATTVFTGFDGTLDDAGIGTARMTIEGPLSSDRVGTSVHLSLELDGQVDAVPETIRIQILD